MSNAFLNNKTIVPIFDMTAKSCKSNHVKKLKLWHFITVKIVLKTTDTDI